MCGILGRIELSKDTAAFKDLRALTHTLAHRGPDHEAHLIEPPVALGHARLSIIDLDKRSHQPMTDLSGRYNARIQR